MRINKSLFLFALLCSLSSLTLADVVKIENAEIKWHKYYDSITINTSDYIIPKVTQYSDKLVLEFKGCESSNFKTIPERSPRIQEIYPVAVSDEIIHVIIKLKKPVKYEIASIYGKGEVLLEAAEVSDKIVAHFLEEKKEEAVRHEPIKVDILPPIYGKEAEAKTALKGKLIVVDPGHGGGDPGAFSFNGVAEKNLTLPTAKFLVSALRNLGASVLLTRKNDVKRELSDVADFANSTKADIYIGVHYNSIIGKSISGTETYYYTPQSFRLASLVHKKMILDLRRKDRGVRKNMFYTIHHSSMPAILVEPLYITDLKEGLLAMSPAYQKRIAESIAKGVVDYFSR